MINKILLIISTIFIIYFVYLTNKIDTLVEKNKVLNNNYELLNSKYELSIKKTEDLKNKLVEQSKKEQEIYVQNINANKIFDDKDFNKLLIKKNKLMESKINKAIKKNFEFFEK